MHSDLIAKLDGPYREADDRITQSYLKTRLDYCPEDGTFTWKDDPENKRQNWNRKFSGTRAGSIKSGGYRAIWLFGYPWAEHRLAWLYVFGAWPEGDIDHINGNRSDNRIANLRECSRGENLQNTRLRKDNTSGYPGVSFSKSKNRWISRIRVDGKRIWVGTFSDPDSAYNAYLKAKKIHHVFNPVPREKAMEARDG